MSGFPISLARKLEDRKAADAFRELRQYSGMTDFYSNDYLGLSCSARIRGRTEELLLHYGANTNGSGGSRLIAGNSVLAEDTEEYLSAFYGSEAALIFSSGYDANLGLLSCIASRLDTILYDEYAHASIRDGIRLSTAKSFSFRHNSMEDLAAKLRHASGTVFVVTETVFSMDGDEAPLKELVQMQAQYGFHLIADEAHAAGYFGNGAGLCSEAGVVPDIFARIVTFGKAAGVHGAAVLGNRMLKDYLVNFARSFIYTTALPPYAYAAVRAAHEEIAKAEEERQKLEQHIFFFRKNYTGAGLISSRSAIQSVVIPGNSAVKKKCAQLQQENLGMVPVLHPTVPEGKERIRICLHAFNTEEEIKRLVTGLQNE